MNLTRRMMLTLIILIGLGRVIGQDIYLGDLNDDQEVNILDIVSLVEFILGAEPTEYQFQSGDVNSDGELNIQDVVLTVEIILETLCPVFEYQCNPSTLQCCTSHDIEFTVHTFGIISSTIFDSWIFSNDNILAVGEINLLDEGDYSGVQWDGETWQLIDLNYNFMTMYPRGIWVFGYDDIWLAQYSINHWDGNPEHEVTRYWTVDLENYPNKGVYNIWAASENSIYFVGPGGCIVHYNGEEFYYMDSGTDIWLKDVWGYVDPETDEETVWVSGWDASDGSTVLLVYRGDYWEPVYEANQYAWDYLYDHLSNGVLSVWATHDFLYVLTGNGLYQCLHETTGDCTLILETEWFVDYRYQVRGTGDNDIFVSGYNQEIMHYNGETWEQVNYYPGDYLNNIKVKDNVIIAGGERVEQIPIIRALLLHGIRNR